MDNVQLDKPNNLNYLLTPNKPIVPEAVDLQKSQNISLVLPDLSWISTSRKEVLEYSIIVSLSMVELLFLVKVVIEDVDEQNYLQGIKLYMKTATMGWPGPYQ